MSMGQQQASQEEQQGAVHDRAFEDVLAQLAASPDGLDAAAAAQRQQRYGPNRLPEPPRQSPWLRFLRQFHHILIYVLLVAAGLTAFLDHLIDTLVILAVVIVNAVIGFLQEGKAEKAIEAIREMLAPKANVLRDGQRVSVDGTDLVPGDIVLLEPGDRVPADLRLFTARGLQVQEALLTGESVPVEKQTDPVAADAPLGDRSCMAFSGTMVTSGQGQGVVVATGPATELGRISGLMAEVHTLITPLVHQMNKFAKWLTGFILCVAAILLVTGYFAAHYEFVDMFMAVVGLSVAAIPAGLPAVLTITLAVGVQAMAKRHAIVRRLPAIETLGSVSVICTDKTGTLTLNEMMVAQFDSADLAFIIGGNGYEPAGAVEPSDDENAPILQEAGRAAALCNDAALRQQDGQWSVEGDPMEGALLAFAGKTGIDTKQLQQNWPRRDIIPFDARHRYMAPLNHNERNQAFIFLKGAPEQVLSLCETQRSADGAAQPLDRDYWHARAEAIAAQGQRVLALAVREMPPDHNNLSPGDVEHGMILLGMVGLIDPPRPEAIEAVAQCRAAGIRVKMITGDHAATAAAIAKQIGLENADKVLTGADLDGMDEAALQVAALETDIFARTSPEHKLRLVMALQAQNMVVAMTGDGVNDAPALKRADAGIAMGRKGSEAAKEASDLVLADDNFASIAAAVREGRTVYTNIKKVISWTLPTNAGEAMTILLALMLGMALPVTPVQILWINMITAATLGLALAFEPTEDNVMRRPPRAQKEPLLSGHLIWHVVLVSSLFLCGVYGLYSYAIERGYSVELARTIALNTLVVMEIFHLFFIRNIYGTSLTWKAIRGTKIVWLTVILVTAAQFAITYLPPLQAIFATEAVPLWDGVMIIMAGVLLFIIIEAEKQIRLRLKLFPKSEASI